MLMACFSHQGLPTDCKFQFIQVFYLANFIILVIIAQRHQAEKQKEKHIGKITMFGFELND